MQKKQSKTAQQHEKVALKAYQLWQQAGSPQGRDQEFWYTAEVIIQNPPKKTKC